MPAAAEVSRTAASALARASLLLPVAAGGAVWLAALATADGHAGRILAASLVTLGSAWMLTRVARRAGGRDLLEPIHIVFALYALAFPVRAMLGLWMENFWLEESETATLLALLLAFVGYAAFTLGYGSRAPLRRAGWARGANAGWDRGRTLLAAAGFLLASLAGFLVVARIGGSIEYFVLVDPEIKGQQEMSPWFFYLLAVCMLVQVGSLVLLAFSWAKNRHRILSLALFAVALGSSFFISRLSTVALLLMAALLFHYLRQPLTMPLLALLGVLALGYLAFAGLYREWVSPAYNLEETGELAELALEQRVLVTRYVVANFDQLHNVTLLMEDAGEVPGLQLGSTFLPLLVKPIPRVLMPSKPLGASGLLTQTYYPEQFDLGYVTNISAWGEWYLNFWWFGVLLGMAATGALTSCLYQALRGAVGPGSVLLYATLVIALLTWLRGDFNMGATFLVFYTLPAALAVWFVRRAPERAREAAA
jgi:hypothetical protein